MKADLDIHRQHRAKHLRPWTCNAPNCTNPEDKRRFARRDGLQRHQDAKGHPKVASEHKAANLKIETTFPRHPPPQPKLKITQSKMKTRRSLSDFEHYIPEPKEQKPDVQFLEPRLAYYRPSVEQQSNVQASEPAIQHHQTGVGHSRPRFQHNILRE